MSASRSQATAASPDAHHICEPPPEITLGPARLRDLPDLARLQRRAFPPRLAYTLGTLAFLWALPWVRVLAARRGGGMVGVIIGDRMMNGGRVINLAVDPEARRQGVGTALLQAIERVLPPGEMMLMVQVENHGARALYHRTGYLDDEIITDYYGPGRPGLRMRKPRVLDG